MGYGWPDYRITRIYTKFSVYTNNRIKKKKINKTENK